MGSMFVNLHVMDIASKCTWKNKKKTEYIAWYLSKIFWIIFKAV